MPFQDLTPNKSYLAGRNPRTGYIKLGVGQNTKSGVCTLRITIAHDVAERYGWSRGDTLAVQLGEGKDEGLLRLVPTEPGKGFTLGGKADAKTPAERALYLCLSRQWRNQGRVPTCEVEWRPDGQNAVVINLGQEFTPRETEADARVLANTSAQENAYTPKPW